MNYALEFYKFLERGNLDAHFEEDAQGYEDLTSVTEPGSTFVSDLYNCEGLGGSALIDCTTKKSILPGALQALKHCVDLINRDVTVSSTQCARNAKAVIQNL